MSTYENGISTRRAIIDACTILFYKRGFHETSYDDICQEAHVNRGSIYYHFREKENIRYEILWEYITRMKRIAERYCAQSEYLYILVAYMMFSLTKTDCQIRKFHYDFFTDYSIYAGQADSTRFYAVLYNKMWEPFYKRSMISDLAFATVYGYIASCVRMLCEHPDKYDPFELFELCTYSSIAIWGIPKDKIDMIRADIRYYIAQIPEEEIKLRIDC